MLISFFSLNLVAMCKVQLVDVHLVNSTHLDLT